MIATKRIICHPHSFIAFIDLLGNGELKVIYRKTGDQYLFTNVPEYKIRKLLETWNKGQYIREHINGKHDCYKNDQPLTQEQIHSITSQNTSWDKFIAA